MLIVIHNAVLDYFGGDVDKANLWFKTPNPQLGNVTPNDMISSGKTSKLYFFVKESLALNETPE